MHAACLVNHNFPLCRCAPPLRVCDNAPPIPAPPSCRRFRDDPSAYGGAAARARPSASGRRRSHVRRPAALRGQQPAGARRQAGALACHPPCPLEGEDSVIGRRVALGPATGKRTLIIGRASQVDGGATTSRPSPGRRPACRGSRRRAAKLSRGSARRRSQKLNPCRAPTRYGPTAARSSPAMPGAVIAASFFFSFLPPPSRVPARAKVLIISLSGPSPITRPRGRLRPCG